MRPEEIKAISGLLLVIIFSFIFTIFFSSTSLSQITELPIEITISDIRPRVIDVTVSPSPVNIPAAGKIRVYMWATITDPDGDLSSCKGHFWNTTSSPLSEETARYVNTSCSFVGTGYSAECNCSFTLIYSDAPGTWTGNITGIDAQANTGFNSTAFDVEELASYDFKPSEGIVFPSPMYLGYFYSATNNPLKINNTGNVKLKVYINASDFTGETDPEKTLKISNMTYNSTYPGMGGLTPMQTSPTVTTPAEGIPVYPDSLSGITDKATFWMFHYLTVPLDIFPQVYNTLYWIDPRKL